MSEKTDDRQKRSYMGTFRSKIKPTIAATAWKTYRRGDPKQPSYYWTIERAYEDKQNPGDFKHTGIFYHGTAGAIAEAGEEADFYCKACEDSGSVMPPKLQELLKTRHSEEQLKAISPESLPVLEQSFANVKQAGEEQFWQTAAEAIA